MKTFNKGFFYISKKDNHKKDNHKKNNIIKWIALGAGVLFAVAFLVMFFSHLHTSSLYGTTEGKIVEIVKENINGETKQIIYVDYEVDGVKYSHVELDVNISYCVVGEKVSFEYKLDNPTEITNISFNYHLAFIFIFAAIISFFFAFNFMSADKQKKKEGKTKSFNTTSLQEHAEITPSEISNTSDNITDDSLQTTTDISTHSTNTKIKKDDNKGLIIGGIAFLIGGLVFVFAGIMLAISIKQDCADYKQTNAVIVDVEHTNNDEDSESYILVDYEVNGTKYYSIKITSYRSSYYVGKTITIDYDPEDPSNATIIKDDTFLSYLIIGLGSAVAGLGLGFIIYAKVAKKKARKNANEQSDQNNQNNESDNSNEQEA